MERVEVGGEGKFTVVVKENHFIIYLEFLLFTKDSGNLKKQGRRSEL